jgi:uncharacterized protein (DUF1501 family)
MSGRPTKRLTRRAFLRSAAIASGALALPGTVASLAAHAQSAAGCDSGTPHRFLEIALAGGWDSLLATDPIMGTKVDTPTYQPDYQGYETTVVPGKSNLILGHGLADAAGAFASMPTCFVNGMLVEVTAHELAFNYLLSGRMSLSRTRDFPATAAVAGVSAGCFPAHVILGDPIPLGDTDISHPPLHASSLQTLIQMLGGPRGGDDPMAEGGVAAAQSAISQLNDLHMKRLGPAAQATVAPWLAAEQELEKLYDKRYDQQLLLTEDMAQRYGIDDPYATSSSLPAALMVLKSGLCPFVTVTMGGYDTHASHLDQHIPLMQSFAKSLTALVEDLQSTPDPTDPALTLAETTTVLITSEFTRTPLFNVADGTDHWPTASAILMGKGVADNRVVGATGDDAYALGWESGGPAALDKYVNALKPDDVIATVLDILGVPTETVDEVSTKRLDELRA